MRPGLERFKLLDKMLKVPVDKTSIPLFVPFVVLHRGNVKMELNEKETDSALPYSILSTFENLGLQICGHLRIYRRSMAVDQSKGGRMRVVRLGGQVIECEIL